MKALLKRVLPPALYRPVLTRMRRTYQGSWDSSRRLTPFSRVAGADRGLPLDRYYIENFLKEHRTDIRGRVAEVKNADYIQKYGDGRVTVADVLDIDSTNPMATIVCDLTAPAGVPVDAYDCLLMTQVFSCLFDVEAAISNCYRALRPGGVLLATVSGIVQISRFDMQTSGEYWRFTTLSAQRLVANAFPSHSVSVRAYGNVFVASAMLYGLATEELTTEELDFQDPDYEMLITVRAVKEESPHGS
ncbi:MAG: glycosyl transferase family 2 [Chthonomonadaceae bacterium]|nr:glycosyl transferase family 2 [Chthonomonadaceae bacterium]